jgi:hypothetical protein
MTEQVMMSVGDRVFVEESTVTFRPVRWPVGKAVHMVGWDTEGEPVIVLTRPNDDGSLQVIGEQRGAEAKRQLLEAIKHVVFR